MSSNGRFSGKVAVVLGGSSGIGLATAHRLHHEGASVVIAARRESEGEVAVAAIGDGASFRRTDIVVRGEVEELFEHAVSLHGRLDVVVNCAGNVIAGPTMDVRERHWQRAIDVNLTGVFHVCQSAVPHLRATIAAGLATQGAIVNVVSIDAMAGDRGMASYNAAKAGALNFSRSFAIELASEGIRINTVSPGAIDTPMAKDMKANPTVLAAFHEAIPIGRLGRPEEVAAAIAFAAAEESGFMIGANLVIDGGVTAGTGHPNILRLYG